MMPMAIVSVNDSVNPCSPPMATPAEKNAKTGTANPADIGRIWCSRYSAIPGPAFGPPFFLLRRTGTTNPSSTPATVACTPEACTSAQAAKASGMSRYQARIRFCTSTAKRASGTRASSSMARFEFVGVEERDDRDREEVVDHREGEQEGAESGREMGADHGEYRQREGDVGRGGDRPTVQRR